MHRREYTQLQIKGSRHDKKHKKIYKKTQYVKEGIHTITDKRKEARNIRKYIRRHSM